MNTITKNQLQNGRFIPRTYTDLLDGFFNNSFIENKKHSFLPSTDIAEDEKSFYLNLSIPGFEKETVSIEVQDNQLTISGERKKIEEENSKTFHLVESHFGSFKRSFKLPENINKEAIEAEHKNGILSIKLPKAEVKNLKTTITIK